VIRVVAEPAEVNDLAEPSLLGCPGEPVRAASLAFLESSLAERVHEVVGDLGALHCAGDTLLVVHVGRAPSAGRARPGSPRASAGPAVTSWSPVRTVTSTPPIVPSRRRRDDLHTRSSARRARK
jgi:hypothetical protein